MRVHLELTRKIYLFLIPEFTDGSSKTYRTERLQIYGMEKVPQFQEQLPVLVRIKHTIQRMLYILTLVQQGH